MGWVEDAAGRGLEQKQGSSGMGFDPLSAGIGVAGQLGGAVLGGKAQKQAAKAQAATTDKALAFSREQEATRKAVYDQKMAQYTAMRNALAQRYGIDLGSFATPPTTGQPGAEVGAGRPAPGGAGMFTGGGVPLPERPVTGQPGPGGPMVPQEGAPASGGSLADILRSKGEMEGWNDWSRQGIPQA